MDLQGFRINPINIMTAQNQEQTLEDALNMPGKETNFLEQRQFKDVAEENDFSDAIMKARIAGVA